MKRAARRHGWLWGVLVALLGMAGYLLFHATFRKVEQEQVVGFRGPALHDPYYVLRAFLEEVGYTQSTLQAPSDVPVDEAVLLWLSDQPPPDAYFDWTGAGGHLIVDVDPFEEDSDVSDLFDWFSGGEAPLVRRQYQYGDGSVTVLRDARSLTNGRFPDSSGPEQLLSALSATDWIRHVLLYTPPEPPWFGALLVRRAWPALLGLCVALGLLLWRASRAFGPPLPLPELARRSVLEHLRAVGQLAVRTDSVQSLCAQSRRELRKRLARRFPTGTELPDERLVERLSAFTQLPPSVVRDALLEPTGRQPAQWVRIARAQQQLWRLS